ncbi:DUF4173 domain-containing protein [Bifidobacterium sp. ESL0784]|uniref:DUF4153 domain-containing protein n=1 Tax=Bifidobacterium sp. ESL0784 TaxID=2983231 RepID=UPI0023F90B4C|nr:DUF4153 domain-containing protein [Bifidobacterium sp. ESL0784]MDF7641513.1 DUF4173 domain-containing protein [Bifidobacterium sp. ESL0784]
MDKDNYTQNQPEPDKNKPDKSDKPSTSATGPNANPYTQTPTSEESKPVAESGTTKPTGSAKTTGTAKTANAESAKTAGTANTANTEPAKAAIKAVAEAPAKVPPAPLTKADKASLICAVALSLLWCVCVSPVMVSAYFAVFGGMALSACLLAFLACAWFLRRKKETGQASKTKNLKGTKRFNLQMPKSSCALLLCTAALMLVPAFSQAAWIRAINACGLSIALPLTFLSLSGESDDELFRLRGVLRGIGTFIAEQFRHWSVLGRVATSWAHGRGRKAGGIAIGAVCAAAVLLIVIPALSSADENFELIVNRLFEGLTHFGLGPRVLDIIRFVAVIPLAFSLLFALRHPHRKADSSANVAHYQTSTATLNTMLTMLDVVYLVFVAIQSSYLFGGVDTLKRFGGYAAYARAGFFQLVGVTAINLVIVMVCTYLHKYQKRSVSLLLLELVLVASTLVMLVSAAWRMSLYVEKYGLTRLRLLTYWGMAAIAFLLIVTAVKLVRPTFALFRAAFFGTLALWLVFAFIQPDAIIAKVDVDGYLNGSIEMVDTDYLSQLPSSTAGPLARLEQQAPSKSVRNAAANALREVHSNTNEITWSLWGI